MKRDKPPSDQQPAVRVRLVTPMHAATSAHSPNSFAVETEATSADEEAPLAAGATPDRDDSGLNHLPRGTTLGRYVLLEPIGAGGMGVVYSAFDPDLDRKVAVKLIRSDVSVNKSRDYLRARLLREAQIMAKISHPNVVTVLDVGTFASDRVDEHAPIFVAMEFVTGETMAEWLTRSKPRWSLALKMYRAAGRGLAAAHHAGLIHRDFKPSNVLVGRDGRVCVADFGIARSLSEPADDDDRPDDDDDRPMATPTEVSLTRSGAVMGTPRYMAPEQRLGLRTDARTDQFSFAVSVWEAVYGEHPYAREDKLVEDLRLPTKKQSVPSRIRRALTRALSTDPDERFPTIDALLSALDGRPPARRKLAAAVGVVAAAAIAGVFFMSGSSPTVSVCSSPPAELDAVWDSATKQRTRDAFAASGAPFWKSSWKRVETTLDAYADRWLAASSDNCEATQTRKSQSMALMGLRAQCLSSQLARFGAVVDILTEADPGAVAKAVDMVHSLDKPDRCADAAHVRVSYTADNAGHRDNAAPLTRQLARAFALRDAGKLSRAKATAEPLVRRSQELNLSRVEARAHLFLATVNDQLANYPGAENSARHALRLAMANNQSLLEAQAWTELVWVVGYRKAKYDRGLELAGYAGGAVDRGGRVNALAARLHEAEGAVQAKRQNNKHAESHYRKAVELIEADAGSTSPRLASALTRLGDVLSSLTRYDEAITVLRRALAVRRDLFGADHPHIADTLESLGTVFYERGDYKKAVEFHRRALAIVEAAFGPNHASVGEALNNLANGVTKLGTPKEAAALYERARVIYERLHTGDHPDLATMFHSLGNSYKRLGKYERALTMYYRARDMWTRLVGGKHRQVAQTLNGVANTLVKLNRRKEAVGVYEQARDIWRAALGSSHPHVAVATYNLGESQMKLGQLETARASFADALKTMVAKLPPTHPLIAYPLIGLGRVALRQKRAHHAVAQLRRAMALLEKRGDTVARGSARFLLARALWSTGGDRKRIYEQINAARVELKRGGAQADKTVKELDTWLAKHPQRRR